MKNVLYAKFIYQRIRRKRLPPGYKIPLDVEEDLRHCEVAATEEANGYAVFEIYESLTVMVKWFDRKYDAIEFAVAHNALVHPILTK